MHNFYMYFKKHIFQQQEHNQVNMLYILDLLGIIDQIHMKFVDIEYVWEIYHSWSMD
jgi:hypothetical protein